MYCHFMQDGLPPHERGIFLAGDDISWTPGWVEGAVTTGLNAVWGILHHLGGHTPPGQSRPRRPFRGAGAGGAAGLSGGNPAPPEGHRRAPARVAGTDQVGRPGLKLPPQVVRLPCLGEFGLLCPRYDKVRCKSRGRWEGGQVDQVPPMSGRACPGGPGATASNPIRYRRFTRHDFTLPAIPHAE